MGAQYPMIRQEVHTPARGRSASDRLKTSWKAPFFVLKARPPSSSRLIPNGMPVARLPRATVGWIYHREREREGEVERKKDRQRPLDFSTLGQRRGGHLHNRSSKVSCCRVSQTDGSVASLNLHTSPGVLLRLHSAERWHRLRTLCGGNSVTSRALSQVNLMSTESY